MRLNRRTDNALRCLTLLALHPEIPVTAREIAERMNMSPDHLFKVVARLADLGLVETQRGRSGGVRLAKPPSAIRVGRVVRDMEESFVLVECFDPDSNRCPIAPACQLTTALDRALKAFMGVLDDVTIADLVSRPKRLELLLSAV